MKSPSVNEIEDVFFAAMAYGYAGNAPTIPIPGFAGSHAIQFIHVDFRVIDAWITTPHSDMSDGFTMIRHRGALLWSMHYGGWYAKSAIPILKSILHSAYVADRIFYGGRGHPYIQADEFTYRNDIVLQNFARFRGKERLVDGRAQPLGMHWYRGGLMTENEEF